METKELRVYVEERKTADGRAFNVYKVLTKKNTKCDLKFTRDVKNLPTKNCYIVVDVDKMSYNTQGAYPVTWVSEVKEIKELTEVNREKNRAVIDEMF